MKTQFSTVTRILLVIAVLAGCLAGINLQADLVTENVKKGAVTAGLVRGIGVKFPDSLLEKINTERALENSNLSYAQKTRSVQLLHSEKKKETRNEAKSVSPKIHHASVIPAQADISENKVTRTSAELVAEPFAENMFSAEQSAGNSLTEISVSEPEGIILPDETNSLAQVPFAEEISTSEMSSGGAEALSGEETLSGEKTLSGEEVLSGAEALSGEETLAGAETLTGEETLSGAETLAGEETLSGEKTLSGEEVLSGAETLSGEEVLSGAETLAGEENSGSGAFPVSEISEMVPVQRRVSDSRWNSPSNEDMVLESSELHSSIGQNVGNMEEGSDEESRSVPLSSPLEEVSGNEQESLQPVEVSEDEMSSADLKPAVPSIENHGVVVQGNGKPGEARLEGLQSSRLTIEKKAPQEIQVGSVSTWTITVRNEGKTDAAGVQIHDTVPRGTQLVNTYPPAKVSRDGEITWNVGVMPSGTMAVVKLELLPVQEGEIGSVASVTTRSEASAKSKSTRPLLKIETAGNSRILLGEQTELLITVSNPGTGVTRNVVLSETVPPELQFEGGAELLYQVGDLQPGESKTTKLPLTAVRPGKFANKVIAKSEPGLQVESVLDMEVTAPALELKLSGPSKRFLDKEGTYSLILKNTGTAAAKNVELMASVPVGWKFGSANNFGTFLPEDRLTAWKLEELGPGETAEAEVTLIPAEIGTFSIQCEAAADICQGVSDSRSVSVEGIAALMFQVVDSNDPIQVGEKTTYSVEVVNQGSKHAENVQVVVDVPTGLEVVSSEENVRSTVSSNGKQLVFEVIPTLGPKAKKTYRFTLRGAASGDQRVAVKLSSREFPTPIVKEESTRVFEE